MKANEMVEKMLSTRMGKRMLKGHIVRKDLDEMTIDDIENLYQGLGCDDLESNTWFWETFGATEWITVDGKLTKRPQEEIEAHTKAGVEFAKEFVEAVKKKESEILG